MAQMEPKVDVVVVKRGKNGKAAGVVFDGKVYNIGEKITAPKSDANYLIASGKCAPATQAAAKK